MWSTRPFDWYSVCHGFHFQCQHIYIYKWIYLRTKSHAYRSPWNRVRLRGVRKANVENIIFRVFEVQWFNILEFDSIQSWNKFSSQMKLECMALGKIWLNNYTHGNWILEISVEILLDSKRSKRRKECCTEKRSGVMKRTNGYLKVSFKATRVHLKLLKLTCKQYFQLAGCIERLVHVHIKQCIISSCTHKCSANILSH